MDTKFFFNLIVLILITSVSIFTGHKLGYSRGYNQSLKDTVVHLKETNEQIAEHLSRMKMELKEIEKVEKAMIGYRKQVDAITKALQPLDDLQK